MANLFKKTKSTSCEDMYIPGNKPKLEHQMSVDCPSCLAEIDCEHCTAGMLRCKVCLGMAGSTLTSDCPGYAMYPRIQQAVAAGELDYLDGFWIDPRKPKKQEFKKCPLELVGFYEDQPLYGDPSLPPSERKLTYFGVEGI